ncbi:MAG TPA: alpha/beta hydrolase [Kofleriaceae bacterium]|nr:alpha/beta hydrolase [Kofleriaceae bacterium]
MTTIDRRALLRSTAAAAGGLTALAAGASCAGASGASGPPAAPGSSAKAGGGPAHAGSFIETRDGTRLFHLDWGSGAPVVFLHAWALNADLWEYQMTELAERGLRCIAYDRRGHGRSSDPGRGYDFDTLADDLAAVLDRLDLRGVTLVAHSMGGGEVARYLSRHGSARIARAVLVSTVTPIVGRAPDNPEGADPKVYEAMIAGLKADRPAAVAGGLPLFTGTRSVSPAMTQWLTDQFLRSSLKACIECMRAIAAADFRADLRAFTIPTLVIHGDADQLNRLDRTGRRTAEAIRGSELKIYPGAPHGVILTDKQQFTRDVLAFAGG